MTRRRVGGRWGFFALGAACLVIAVGAVRCVRSPSAADVPDEVVEVAQELGIDIEAMTHDARASSPERFLDDLDEADDGDASVTWSVSGDLVEPASDVIRAYRDMGTATLVTSGYLDLKGNVWGALAQGGTDWVDMVVVTTTEDGGETTVRVARLRADDG
ncbi:hypothetical protein [Collinsella tanakaei]|uniref:hypothetical protein n=1 Tax=Collinsella tanakaei TaxID=626935 RepID=UPI0025A40046|nr:hypothetical protein [Collinsella tanakaei]MDM8302457.1 hypothetical protein [Collinsella tanakaei]